MYFGKNWGGGKWHRQAGEFEKYCKTVPGFGLLMGFVDKEEKNSISPDVSFKLAMC